MQSKGLIPWSSTKWPAGMRLGRLTVMATFKKPGEHWSQSRYFAECLCDCGSRHFVSLKNLHTGNTQSCGCVMRDGRQKSGLTHHPIGRVWRNMLNRCYRPQTVFYENYGGRGITVCPQWHDLTNFAADMLPSYAPGLTLDRIDSDSDYSPDNCRWATMKQQSRNRRSNLVCVINGEKMCVEEWAERYSISARTIRARIHSGWPHERAITTPVQSRKRIKSM